ncbi:MAG TPA: hypothetical protein VNS09_02215 [Solirubrobacter sp.]|nr:hypothetical protein [Solirubrobacter sp.]
MSVPSNTLRTTVDEHGEIHVSAVEAARLGVEPGQTVVLAAVERPAIRRLPEALTIEQLAAKQGKVRGALRGAADFPQVAASDDELEEFLRLIGARS